MTHIDAISRSQPAALASKTTQEYLNWFNSCKSMEEALKTGMIVFSHLLFTPDFYNVLGDPRQKTALEIGFGGGRLMHAASYYFEKVVGIDIHQAFERTAGILDELGVPDYELLHSDDRDKIEDKSVDFVYSFIVFQHFSSWQIAEDYIKLIDRVLAPGGCGIIYFAKGGNKKGYTEIPNGKSKHWWSSLRVDPEFAAEEMGKYFEVIGSGVSHLWGTRKSGQFFVKFKRKK